MYIKSTWNLCGELENNPVRIADDPVEIPT
jgi:hypothetical protein